MRVIEELISHLTRSGHLTDDQLAELQRMGLVKKEPDGFYGPDDFEDYEYYPDSNPQIVVSDHFRTDALDALGDRLLDEAKAAGRPKAGRRGLAAADSKMIAAVEESVRQEDKFLELAVKVARRLDPQADAADANRVIESADAARLDASLSRDTLWAKLWPHIQRTPILATLDERASARFGRVIAARGFGNKSVPTRVVTDPWIRRGIELLEAHRTLCEAFGRVALAIDPWRVYWELEIPVNHRAYEVLVILFNARIGWRRVKDLPRLTADVGLPSMTGLPDQPFVVGWDIAATIDPMAVLPMMEWCTAAWATMPSTATCQGLVIDGVFYDGTWIPSSKDEWFGMGIVESRWSRARFGRQFGAQPGQWSGRMTIDGHNFVHVCETPDCDLPKWFHGAHPRYAIRVAAPDWQTDRDWRFSGSRANYGQLWSAGLLNMPVLTCPKEWELT